MALLTLKFATDVRDEDYEVVEFHGELDQSTVSNAEKQVNELLENYKRKYLIFDLTNLKYINSEGIGFVVSTHVHLVKKTQSLIVCGMRPNVEEVFAAMGLPKLFQVFKTISEAISSIKK